MFFVQGSRVAAAKNKHMESNMMHELESERTLSPKP